MTSNDDVPRRLDQKVDDGLRLCLTARHRTEHCKPPAPRDQSAGALLTDGKLAR
jgi:hypothetical protein